MIGYSDLMNGISMNQMAHEKGSRECPFGRDLGWGKWERDNSSDSDTGKYNFCRFRYDPLVDELQENVVSIVREQLNKRGQPMDSGSR